MVWGSTGEPNSRLPWCARIACSRFRSNSSGKPSILSRCLADHVPPHQDVADQATFLRVLCLDRMILELAQLADVVQDRGGDDQAPVERWIELVVILGVVVRQEAGDPSHAPDVLQQPGRV